MSDDALAAWLLATLGRRPETPAIFVRALTHGSHPSGESYERLEFLGDRVLGLVMAEWLYTLFPQEPEGKLSRRFNALVSGETCAAVARDIDVALHMRLGKQARDDGAVDSDYVLGDIMEALIGALYLDAGHAAARDFVRTCWRDRVEHQERAPKHPKSALQELVAAKGWRAPVYALVSRTGPHHAPRFAVSVEVPGREAASAEGATKQEAETAAARALMERLSARRRP